jgi:hypothetical protein
MAKQNLFFEMTYFSTVYPKNRPPSYLSKSLYDTYNMYIVKKVCSEKQKVVAVCQFSSLSFLETVRQFSFPSFCVYMEPEDFCYCLLIITSCQIHSSSTFGVWLNNLQYFLPPEQSILYTVHYSTLYCTQRKSSSTITYFENCPLVHVQQ